MTINKKMWGEQNGEERPGIKNAYIKKVARSDNSAGQKAAPFYCRRGKLFFRR